MSASAARSRAPLPVLPPRQPKDGRACPLIRQRGMPHPQRDEENAGVGIDTCSGDRSTGAGVSDDEGGFAGRNHPGRACGTCRIAAVVGIDDLNGGAGRSLSRTRHHRG